jgi:hypothetical protein
MSSPPELWAALGYSGRGLELHLQRPGSDLGLSDIHADVWIGRIREHGDPGELRDGLLEQLSRLPTSSGPTRELTPVTFPPGRARLVTNPKATGSPAAMKTMGKQRPI